MMEIAKTPNQEGEKNGSRGWKEGLKKNEGFSNFKWEFLVEVFGPKTLSQFQGLSYPDTRLGLQKLKMVAYSEREVMAKTAMVLVSGVAAHQMPVVIPCFGFWAASVVVRSWRT